MTKARLLKLHRWVGLALALLFVVQATSGIALVFRDELERMIHPELNVAPPSGPIALAPLLTAARQAAPAAKLQRLELPGEAGQAVIASLRGKDGEPILVALDPSNAEVLRKGGLGQWPTEWLFRLHESLLAGETGDIIVGIEGIALLFVAIVGLMTWWPAGWRWKGSLRVIRGHGTQRLVQSLHRALGAIAAALLILSAVTGALMVFRPALQVVLPLAKKPSFDVPARTADPVPIDDLVALARARHGALKLDQIRFQGKAAQIVALYFDDDRSLRRNATRQYYHDAYDGSELGIYDPAQVPVANTAFDWLFTIHTGKAAYLPGRIAILLGGVTLLFLSISGPWLWLAARRKRRRRAGGKA